MIIRSEARVRAPEFPKGVAWLNSEPLSMAALKNKVILVDFWDYCSSNCIRTLPYIMEWHRRYAPYGLIVIGVHTPEFDFAKDLKNVENAVRRFGITYPVVLDNENEIWTRYANQYWPHEYLIDGEGYIVYDHVGEDPGGESELQIQTALAKTHPTVRFPEPFHVSGAPESGSENLQTTPELYLGFERGRLGNPVGYNPNFVVMYQDPGNHEDGPAYASGPWENRSQSLRHARSGGGEPPGYIAIRYHARSVNAVMRPAGESPYRVNVQQDGFPVPTDNRGADLQQDSEGMTFVAVTEPRLYRIINNRQFGEHSLRLSSKSSSFDLYAFSFGSYESAD